MKEQAPIKVNLEREAFQLTCKCGRIITGSSENSCKFNMRIHKEKCDREIETTTRK